MERTTGAHMRLSRLRLGERPTLRRVAVVDILVILVGAVGGTLLARRLSGGNPWPLIATFFVVGSAAVVLFDYFMLRYAFRSLEDLSRVMATIHKGEGGSSVPADPSDRGLSTATEALATMLDRLEGESHAYSSLIFASIEEERRRIGRELHDETSQSLAAALLDIDIAERGFGECSPEVKERVDNARALITHCLGQIRLLVYDLRPSMLDDFGLVPALRWYVKSHLEPSGLAVETDFEDGEGRLPADVETGLYRIAQESLANVMKHSGATRASLRLETKPGYAVVAIEDNGVGFAAGADKQRDGGHGVGLLSMRERAASLGGTLHVESSAGRGTRVHVVIPIKGGADQ
jgi:two-component system sensor histidine kinase UhpB